MNRGVRNWKNAGGSWKKSAEKNLFLTVLVLGTGLKGLNINEFLEI